MPTLWWKGEPKLVYENSNFLSLTWIRKNWKVQLKQYSKIPIFNLFVNQEKFEVQPKTNIQKSQFKSKGELNVPIWVSLLKIMLEIQIKWSWIHFKLNIMNEIYNLLDFYIFVNENKLGKWIFHWEKWNLETVFLHKDLNSRKLNIPFIMLSFKCDHLGIHRISNLRKGPAA